MPAAPVVRSAPSGRSVSPVADASSAAGTRYSIACPRLARRLGQPSRRARDCTRCRCQSRPAASSAQRSSHLARHLEARGAGHPSGARPARGWEPAFSTSVAAGAVTAPRPEGEQGWRCRGLHSARRLELAACSRSRMAVALTAGATPGYRACLNLRRLPRCAAARSAWRGVSRPAAFFFFSPPPPPPPPPKKKKKNSQPRLVAGDRLPSISASVWTAVTTARPQRPAGTSRSGPAAP